MTLSKEQMELTDISSELKRLWDEKQGENKIRASLFNLILYVQNDSRTGYYEEMVKSVVGKFPCRVIFIVGEESPQKEYLRSSVTAQTIGEGDLEIYCETIRIDVGGSLLERVPFLIVPNLLPDLPIYLLWAQDPALDSAVLPHLQPYAHRIIFDADSTPNLQNYSRSVLSLIQSFKCDVGDLNWSAISGWRELFSQVFDTLENLIILVESKIIRIHYNKQPTPYLHHNEIEAAYFQAWIASRLNWKCGGVEMNEGNIRLTYRRPTDQVAILLIPEDDPKLKAGTITSVEIESVRNKTHYSFKRRPESRQVFVQYSDKDQCSLPYCQFLSGSSEGQEIINEIFYPPTGEHYQSTLEVLSTTPWKPL